MKLVCEVCGKEIKSSQYSNCNICSSECHTKYFWKNFIKNLSNIKALIDGDEVFIYEPHDISKEQFSGRQFELKFNDKHVEISNYIWFIGKIPPEVKSELKDNIKMSNVKTIETLEHYNQVKRRMK